MKDFFPSPQPPLEETERVDPDKLDIGDRFAFVYARGTRSGKRRTVELTEKRVTETGLLLIADELDKNGNSFSRHYWPSLTSATRYFTRHGIRHFDKDGRESERFVGGLGLPMKGRSSRPLSLRDTMEPVSYTHLTLPTIYSV